MKTIRLVWLLLGVCALGCSDAGGLIVVEHKTPLPVQYCGANNTGMACAIDDKTTGVCLSQGVCTWTCATADDCPSWDCNDEICVDGACIFPASKNGTACDGGMCVDGSCQSAAQACAEKDGVCP